MSAESQPITPADMPNLDPALTDQELIAALNAGEDAAFETMYLRHRDWVTQMAFRITGDRDAAFTVLQETFRYFADKFPGFQLTCQLRSFLYPVVKNLAFMECRKVMRVQRLQEKLVGTTWPHVNPTFPAGDTLSRLLDVLSEEHREVVALRFVEDFDVSDIAAALDIPEGTVKSRLHHALKQLRGNPRTRQCFPDYSTSQTTPASPE